MLELHRHRGKAHPELTDYVWVGERELRNLNAHEAPLQSRVTPEQRRAMKRAITELTHCGFIESTQTLWKTKPWQGPRKCYKLREFEKPNLTHSTVDKRTDWSNNAVSRKRQQVYHENSIMEGQRQAIAADQTVWPSLPLWEMPKLQEELRERTTGAADGYLQGTPSVFNDATGRTIGNATTIAGTCKTGLNIIHIANFETHHQKRMKPSAITALGQNATEQMFLLMIWLFALPMPTKATHLPPLTVYDPRAWAAILNVHPKSLRTAAQRLQERGVIWRAKEGRGAHATAILTSAIACTKNQQVNKLNIETRGRLENCNVQHCFTYDPTTGTGFAKPRTVRQMFRGHYNSWRCMQLAKKAEMAKAEAKLAATSAKISKSLAELGASAEDAAEAMKNVFQKFEANTAKMKPPNEVWPAYQDWVEDLQQS